MSMHQSPKRNKTLDEAASEYAEKHDPKLRDTLIACFKAGAIWELDNTIGLWKK